TALTECTASEYEALAPTATSDRVCKQRPSLTDLALSAGTVDPVFSPNVFDYTAEVGLFAQTITVTPIADPADATITVDGAMSRRVLNLGDGRVGDYYAAFAFVATGAVAFSC